MENNNLTKHFLPFTKHWINNFCLPTIDLDFLHLFIVVLPKQARNNWEKTACSLRLYPNNLISFQYNQFRINLSLEFYQACVYKLHHFDDQLVLVCSFCVFHFSNFSCVRIFPDSGCRFHDQSSFPQSIPEFPLNSIYSAK